MAARILGNNYKRKSNPGCGLIAMCSEAKYLGRKAYLIIRRRCKSWRCPRCGAAKRVDLKHAIVEVAHERKLTWWLSLTMDPHTGVWLTVDWNRIHARLRKRLGMPMSYIWLREAHESGSYHLHVLMDERVDPSWLPRESEVKLTWGPITDLEGLVSYVLKGVTSLPPKIRRFGSSRDIKLTRRSDTTRFQSTERLFDEVLNLQKNEILDLDRNLDGSIERFWSDADPRTKKESHVLGEKPRIHPGLDGEGGSCRRAIGPTDLPPDPTKEGCT